MKTTTTMVLLSVFASTAVFAPQDRGGSGAQDPRPAGTAVPRPAPPPPDAGPLPVVDEPFVTPVPRLDLPGRLDAPDPVEGYWQLRARTLGGQAVEPGHGYLAIGRAHLLVHLIGREPGLDVPLLRAGTYRWQRTGGESVQMRVVLGHFNDEDGDVQLEPAGKVEVRRFQLGGDFLRIHQPNGDYLEFVRMP